VSRVCDGMADDGAGEEDSPAEAAASAAPPPRGSEPGEADPAAADGAGSTALRLLETMSPMSSRGGKVDEPWAESVSAFAAAPEEPDATSADAPWAAAAGPADVKAPRPVVVCPFAKPRVAISAQRKIGSRIGRKPDGRGRCSKRAPPKSHARPEQGELASDLQAPVEGH
jgi:hypothetical protein